MKSITYFLSPQELYENWVVTGHRITRLLSQYMWKV